MGNSVKVCLWNSATVDLGRAKSLSTRGSGHIWRGVLYLFSANPTGYYFRPSNAPVKTGLRRHRPPATPPARAWPGLSSRRPSIDHPQATARRTRQASRLGSAADRLGARAALGLAGGASPAPPAVSPTSCNAVVAAPAADAPAIPAPHGGPAIALLVPFTRLYRVLVGRSHFFTGRIRSAKGPI